MENVLSAVMKTEGFSQMSARFSDLKVGITELSFPRGASSAAKISIQWEMLTIAKLLHVAQTINFQFTSNCSVASKKYVFAP